MINLLIGAFFLSFEASLSMTQVFMGFDTISRYVYGSYQVEFIALFALTQLIYSLSVD